MEALYFAHCFYCGQYIMKKSYLESLFFQHVCFGTFEVKLHWFFRFRDRDRKRHAKKSLVIVEHSLLQANKIWFISLHRRLKLQLFFSFSDRGSEQLSVSDLSRIFAFQK